MVYLLVTIFYYHIDKHFTGVPFVLLTLLVPVTFVWMLVIFIKGLLTIFRKKAVTNYEINLPTIISGITLMYTCFSPYRLNSEKLESKAIVTGYFKGTQNQAVIRLRADKSFELNWTGVFGYDEWFAGTYTQTADTVFLTYKTKRPFRFGTKILNNGEILETLDKPASHDQYFVPFIIKQPLR